MQTKTVFVMIFNHAGRKRIESKQKQGESDRPEKGLGKQNRTETRTLRRIGSIYYDN